MIAVAHRGDWSEHPENTPEAFAAAVAAGADMIELDVRLAADGRPVVLHDATLDRIWGVARPVSALTRDEVVALGIPDFEQALASVPANVHVMVDYKDEDVAGPALAAVAAAGALDRAVFAGDCFQGHRCIRSLAPAARIAVTWDRHERIPDALLDELDAEFYNPSGAVLARDRDAVARMHARGTRVSVWTIDEPAGMELFLDLGVDAIITNRIGALVELLGARC